MRNSNYYVIRLISSVIIAGGYYLVTALIEKSFDVFELAAYILILYIGTIAVNYLAERLDKKTGGASD